MADVDTELVSSLRKAKKTPMFFAFVAKGTDGKLLVDKTKISPKKIAEAKQECGGGTIYAGRCLDEEGTMVFEVPKEPPDPLSAQIKKIIKRDAALTMDVLVRMNAALESQETEAETPPSSPAAGRVTARLAALAPVLQKIEPLKTPEAEAVKQAIAEVKASVTEQKYDAALGSLDVAESRLKELLKAGIDKAGAEPVPTDASVSAAALLARLNKLSAAIKQAVAANPARKDDVLGPVAFFQTQLKNNQLGPAAETLLKLEALLPQLTTAPPPAGDPRARQAALAEWQAMRALAVEQLTRLGDQFKAVQDPEADQAIILLRAIRANLTLAPDTLKKVSELEKYIQTDDIIAEAEVPNGFGIVVQLREPLLRALADLKKTMTA